MKRVIKNRVIGSVVALAIMLCMLFGMSIPASATEDEVRNAKSGVLFFIMTLKNDNSDIIAQWRGSSFLINDHTIVTANHCVHLGESWYQYFESEEGLSRDYVDKHLSYEVVISRDLTVSATLTHSSTKMDFAILELNNKINNRTPLMIRDSQTVEQAEKAYSIGFPASKDATTQTENYYNEKDMIIESGILNRGQYTEERDIGDGYGNLAFHFVGDILTFSSATSSGGNSGGPMVDEDGCVIGIVSHGWDSTEGSSWASASSQLIEALDALGIEYKKCKHPHDGGSVPVPVDPLEELESTIKSAKKYKAKGYTEDSFADLQDAIEEAQEVLDAEDKDAAEAALKKLNKAISGLEPVDDGHDSSEDGGGSKKKDTDDEKDTNWVLIAIIAGGALILIVVVVVVIIVIGKGKKQPEQAPQAAAAPPVLTGANVPPQIPYGNAPNAPPQAPYSTGTTVAPQASNETTVLSSGGSETTVLSGDGSETTVLSRQVDGGKLIRTSNNEVIPITYSGFTIGKKRKEVDYCVADNTNVSRNHAKFIVRDGATYVVDNKSTNGTFVNNSTVRPGDEVELKDGDTVMLADEKFEYKK